MEILAIVGAVLTMLGLFPAACGHGAACLSYAIETIPATIWRALGVAFWVIWAYGMIFGGR